MFNILLRKGFAFGIIALFVGAGFSTSKQIEVLDTEIIVGPYTQDITDTGITIVWETNIATTNNRKAVICQ